MTVSLSIPEVGLVVLMLILLILVFVLVLIVFWIILMLWRALVIYDNNISDGLRKKKECEKDYKVIYTLEDLKPHPLYYFFIFFSK